MRCKSTGIGKILRKCISERAKLQYFTEFHGNVSISRKTVHFAVRVMAVKSRNRLGLSYRPKYGIDKLPSILCGMIKWFFWHTFSAVQ